MSQDRGLKTTMVGDKGSMETQRSNLAPAGWRGDHRKLPERHWRGANTSSLNMFTKPGCVIIYRPLQPCWWWWFSRQVVSDSCDPMDYSPPGSSVLGILQARTLEWVAISFSRGSSQPRNLHCRQILYQLSYKGKATSLTHLHSVSGCLTNDCCVPHTLPATGETINQIQEDGQGS